MTAMSSVGAIAMWAHCRCACYKAAIVIYTNIFSSKCSELFFLVSILYSSKCSRIIVLVISPYSRNYSEAFDTSLYSRKCR